MEPGNLKNRRVLICVVAIAVLVGVTFAYGSRGESGADRDGDGQAPEPEAPISMETTLEGRTTCLPHKDTEGPQTLECAFGLESAAGQFYAIDAAQLEPDAAAELNTAERVRVTGLLVPIEAISTGFWQRYDVRGIMRVDSFEAI